MSQKPTKPEDIAKEVLAVIYKDPDFKVVRHFMEYACAALEIDEEVLIDASVQIAKRSEGKTTEAKSLPEIAIGYDQLRECLEDKLKSMCVVLPDGMTIEQLTTKFAEYCRSDVYEWLKDNLKSFVEKYDFPSKYNREEEK